jgi:hypothetical protein
LLEEERHIGFKALTPDFPYPGRIKGPIPRTALAADDGPVHSGQVDFADGADKGLEGDESK